VECLELLMSSNLMELISKSKLDDVMLTVGLGECPDLGGIIATLCRRLPKLDTKALVTRLRTIQNLHKIVQSSMELKRLISMFKLPFFTEMFQVREGLVYLSVVL
jgi:hypothetical protein